MKSVLNALALAIFAAPAAAPGAWAQDTAMMASGKAVVAASTVEGAPLVIEAEDLEQFKWVARPVVVFADSPNDPSFIEQMDLLEARRSDLAERDIVVLVDTDPAAQSALRTKLRPRGFMLVLIGKDGQIKLRKPSPWHVRELTRVVDKMPMRQQELREQRPERITN